MFLIQLVNLLVVIERLHGTNALHESQIFHGDPQQLLLALIGVETPLDPNIPCRLEGPTIPTLINGPELGSEVLVVPNDLFVAHLLEEVA